jgi:hypothetical protein
MYFPSATRLLEAMGNQLREDDLGAAIAGVAVQQAGLIPTIVGMGGVYVVVTIAMFFNPALRGMDVRQERAAEPGGVQPAGDGSETLVASRTTDIH